MEQIELARTAKIGYFNQYECIQSDSESLYNTLKKLDNLPDYYINAVFINLGFNYTDLKRQTNTLSGGERIRLSLAMVFLKTTNILFLDEPTTFLDIETKKSLEKMIQDYPGTILLISHDMEFMHNISDYIYRIENKDLILNYDKERVRE